MKRFAPFYSPIQRSTAGKILLACLLLSLLISACRPAVAATPIPAPGATAGSAAATLTPTQPPTATPAPEHTLWLPPSTPQRLRAAIQLPSGWQLAQQAGQASLRLEVQPAVTANPTGAAAWVYALVAPFPTLADELSLKDLQAAWKSTPGKDSPVQSILMDFATQATFQTLWGTPGKTIRVVDTAKLVDAAWQAGTTTWAIVPFELLEPRWKVMRVEGQSPLHKDFNPATYPLTVYYGLSGSSVDRATFSLPASNRIPEHLTNVTVTGTTALVRGTASYMEGRGIDYPIKNIGPALKEADILHVSNEVAFAPSCPPPFDWKDLKFCSRPKYLQLLQDIGVKVIELTGDHFADWSVDAMRYTIDLYKKEGIQYYGGGENIEDARKPALFENNGNKIAFLGCNAKEVGYATASETSPGAIHCDMDQLTAQIKQLRAEGYLPIVTFQHIEYYQYVALPELQKDFRAAADAGAVIVSGSQAHQPQAMEFKDQAFIHYGLGNLFFDQTNQGDAPRTAFIDRHIFYEGRYISTELLTIYFVDYALSRFMTPPERQDLLQTIFKASGFLPDK